MRILNAPDILNLARPANFGFTKFREAWIVKSLERCHQTAGTSVVSAGGPVVSLTSHGRRVETVYLTVESIGQGRLLPSRLILWLDDEAMFQNLPESLLRLRCRGLEIPLAQNNGPQKKYNPNEQ
jgi:hypothetical protein